MARTWSPDVALDGFEQFTIDLPAENDGPLAATLVRRRSASPSMRAVLYVHGFIDYFFQAHVAAAFNAEGWNFYALDLRRCGRSLREGNRPHFVRDLSDYDAELTAAIDIVRGEEKHETLVLMGHSTGGLVASLYADRGARREDIDGLILNSPFFDFALPPLKRLQLPIGAALGALLPHLSDRNTVSPRYVESISSAYDGEWTFDERWKPRNGFPAYYGWVRAIRRGQAAVRAGLDITCPVLLLHAGRSASPGARGDARHQNHDIVLDVAHMREVGKELGKHVTIRRVEGGIHDLFLSRDPVRTAALRQVFAWIAETLGEKHVTIREFQT